MRHWEFQTQTQATHPSVSGGNGWQIASSGKAIIDVRRAVDSPGSCVLALVTRLDLDHTVLFYWHGRGCKFATLASLQFLDDEHHLPFTKIRYFLGEPTIHCSATYGVEYSGRYHDVMCCSLFLHICPKYITFWLLYGHATTCQIKALTVQKPSLIFSLGYCTKKLLSPIQRNYSPQYSLFIQDPNKNPANHLPCCTWILCATYEQAVLYTMNSALANSPMLLHAL